MGELSVIPFYYDYDSTYTSMQRPGVIHSRNTGLSLFYDRILLQKLFSVYEFNIPDEWDHDYFLYTLFLFGYTIVFNTDKYGVINNHGALYGRNIYYRPIRAVVSNPLLKQIRQMVINQDCALIKLTPDYRGAYDIISMYSDMMAVITEAFGINAINSKLAYVFAASNKTMAESFKALYDKIAGGEPAVVVDKNLFTDDGDPRWLLFDQNLRNNFIGKDLLECLTTIEAKFDATIGINNVNYQKRERLLQDEVNSNNIDTMALCTIWEKSIKDSMQKCNDLFGMNLDVRLRWADYQLHDSDQESEEVNTWQE